MKRGLGLVLGLLLVAIVVSAAATVVLFFLVTPSTRVADRSTLVLRPGGELLEVVPDDVLQFVSRSEARTVRGYVEALRKAKIDKRIAAVLLAPRLPSLPAPLPSTRRSPSTIASGWWCRWPTWAIG